MSRMPTRPRTDTLDLSPTATITPRPRCWELPEEYRKRWGIETGYRDSKRVTPRTVSRNDAIRLALFYLSLIITNIWQFARVESNGIKLVLLLAYMIRLIHN